MKKETLEQQKKQGLRPQNKRESLPSEDLLVFDSLVKSLAENIFEAKLYANRNCRQCTGKGFYQRDNILPANQFRAIDDKKKTRFTPTETQICSCIEKGVVMGIKDANAKALAESNG